MECWSPIIGTASATRARLETSIAELVEDKHQSVYLYCRSGHRSGIGATVMEGLGYSQVTNAGGLGEASELLTEQIIQ